LPSISALALRITVVEHPILHPDVLARAVAAARKAEAAYIAPGGSGKITVSLELDYNGGRAVAARVRVTGEGARIPLNT